MSSTPEKRLIQIKAYLNDPQISDRDKLAYIYHAMLLEVGFWRRNRADAFVHKHGTAVNARIDIANFVKSLANLDD